MPATPTHATTTEPAPAAVLAGPVELVAIDIDGTLLRSDKRMSPLVSEAIAEVQRRGVRVVLATARPPRSVRRIREHLQLDTLTVNYNGALVHDPGRNRHVRHLPLSSEMTWKIIKAARKIDAGVVVSVEILDKWYTDHIDDSLPTETSRAFMPDFIGPLDAFLHVPVTKLMLLAPPVRLAKIRRALDKKFAGQIGMAISDPHLLQIIHPKVDKAEALQYVADHYRVPAERVMAIGDAPNDIGMLNWAGIGVAMENAWQPVRDAADVIVPANDDDGVAFALRRYVLEESV